MNRPRPLLLAIAVLLAVIAWLLFRLLIWTAGTRDLSALLWG